MTTAMLKFFITINFQVTVNTLPKDGLPPSQDGIWVGASLGAPCAGSNPNQDTTCFQRDATNRVSIGNTHYFEFLRNFFFKILKTFLEFFFFKLECQINMSDFRVNIFTIFLILEYGQEHHKNDGKTFGQNGPQVTSGLILEKINFLDENLLLLFVFALSLC